MESPAEWQGLKDNQFSGWVIVRRQEGFFLMKRLVLGFAMVASAMSIASADEKQTAFACLDRAAAAYALSSCELANTIISAAKGSCASEISELTRAVVNDIRFSSLPLQQRLQFADRYVDARTNRMTAIILEARVRAGKSC